MSPLEWRASPNAHLLVGELPVQRQLEGRPWEGTGFSIAAHSAMLMILMYAGMHAPVLGTVSPVPDRNRVVFSIPGHGDGVSSGSAANMSEPARRAERAETPPRHITAAADPVDAITPAITVPVVAPQPMQALPGAPTDFDATALGRGGDRGEGVGPGDGRGPGAGDGGPNGGDAFQPGNGVTTPQLIHEVRPQYTVDAMRAKLQGAIELDVVVLPDGSVDPRRIRVTRSVDHVFGLDEQAILAVRQWRFKPGTLRGRPVPVRVAIELTFTLR